MSPPSVTHLDQVTRINLSPSVTLAIPVATSLDFAALRSISRQVIVSLYETLSRDCSDTKPQQVRSDLIPESIISETILDLIRAHSASHSLSFLSAVASVPARCSITPEAREALVRVMGAMGLVWLTC